MMSVLVDRATSRTLIGPDWAMNTEICEIVNRDQMQAKYVVKCLKSRLKSKNPKVQLLTLTLLETVIKNCGDVVQMHVAEKHVLQSMVKIVRKKPDFQVKEKILGLIDTWQDTFGGPRVKYPEYYAPYQELPHAGAVLPQRPERSAPTLSPLHAQSRFSPKKQEEPESSAGSEFPILSLIEIQNARDMMNTLAEMLNVLDPSNKEGLKEEVIVGLVEQCRSFKRRVFHLVHTTLDEELLSLGLALNDDLQYVLANHYDIASGISIQHEKLKSPPVLVDVDEADGKIPGTLTAPNGSTSTEITAVDPFQWSLLTTSSHSDEKVISASPLSKVDPPVDLLSWDDVDELPTENPLAPVPMNDPPNSSTVIEISLALVPMNYQDILALTVVDGFSSNSTNATTDSFDLHSSYRVPQEYSSANGIQMPPNELHFNGAVPSSGALQYEQENYIQKPQINQVDLILNRDAKQGLNLQQPLNSGINIQSEEALPLPPWEIQSTEEIEPQQLIVMPQLSNLQSRSMQSGEEPGMHHYHIQGGQMTGMQLLPTTQSGQITGMQFQPAVIGRQMDVGRKIAGMQVQPVMQGPTGGNAYSQQPGVHYYNQMRQGYPFASQTDLSQSMYELSMHGNGEHIHINPSSHQMHTSSSVPQKNQKPLKPTRPHDNLFGDLVNIAKIKKAKQTNKPGMQGGSFKG